MNKKTSFGLQLKFTYCNYFFTHGPPKILGYDSTVFTTQDGLQMIILSHQWGLSLKKTRIFIMIIWKIGLKLSIWTLVSITDFFLTGATHKPQFFKGLSTADRFRICFPHSRFSYLAPKFAKKTKFIECTSSTMKLIVSKMTVKFPWIFE